MFERERCYKRNDAMWPGPPPNEVVGELDTANLVIQHDVEPMPLTLTVKVLERYELDAIPLSERPSTTLYLVRG